MAVPVEERVARLEGQVMEQANTMNAVLDTLRGFENRMDQRFLALEERMDAGFARVDARFTQVDARFTSVDARFNSVEARFTSVDARFTSVDERFTNVDARFLQIDDRLSHMDAKMSRQFTWLVGLIATLLVAILGTFGAMMAALVR